MLPLQTRLASRLRPEHRLARFPAKKFRLIHDRLLLERFAEAADFLRPAPASDEDILLVHETGWVNRLKTGTLGYDELMKLELPYSRQMAEAFWLAAGGSILAARCALVDGIGFNVGGGFHHAFPDHGEGFCAISDVAIAIRKLQSESAIRSAMVVDCDVHQGNGTAAIFDGDETVFTISLHQLHNYPFEKPPSNIDVDLPDRTTDYEYLAALENALDRGFRGFPARPAHVHCRRRPVSRRPARRIVAHLGRSEGARPHGHAPGTQSRGFPSQSGSPADTPGTPTIR